jgi:cellulose synthase/poly-beta-1,6-N-acetylglucosamine synthase-like glycosyltransferase
MSLLENISHSLGNLGKFWQQKDNGQVLRSNILIITVQIVLLVYKFNDLPPQVPLFYSLPWGEPQLASASQLFFLPTFSIVFSLINNLLAATIFSKTTLLSKLLVVSSLVISILSLVTLFQIISLLT